MTTAKFRHQKTHVYAFVNGDGNCEHMILCLCISHVVCHAEESSAVSLVMMYDEHRQDSPTIPTIIEHAPHVQRSSRTRANVDLMLYCTCKPANNVFFCRDRVIFRLIPRPLTVREARNPRTPIRTAEKCNRLAERGHPVHVRSTLRSRGCNDTVERRTKYVIAPSRKEIARVHDNSSGLNETSLL